MRPSVAQSSGSQKQKQRDDTRKLKLSFIYGHLAYDGRALQCRDSAGSVDRIATAGVVLVFAGMTRSVGFSFANRRALAVVLKLLTGASFVGHPGLPTSGEARHHFRIRSQRFGWSRRPQACQSVQSCRGSPVISIGAARRCWRQERTFRIRVTSQRYRRSGAGARCRRLRAVRDADSESRRACPTCRASAHLTRPPEAILRVKTLVMAVDFIHRFVPATTPAMPTMLALHGTGATKTI